MSVQAMARNVIGWTEPHRRRDRRAFEELGEFGPRVDRFSVDADRTEDERRGVVEEACGDSSPGAIRRYAEASRQKVR